MYLSKLSFFRKKDAIEKNLNLIAANIQDTNFKILQQELNQIKLQANLKTEEKKRLLRKRKFIRQKCRAKMRFLRIGHRIKPIVAQRRVMVPYYISNISPTLKKTPVKKPRVSNTMRLGG